MTLDTGEGGPKTPIPATKMEVDRGRRWFLRRTESRQAFIRPSASSGRPPLRPPTCLGVAGASPAEKYPSERFGESRGHPPRGGPGAKPLGAERDGGS